jgi:hypothetical protein
MQSGFLKDNADGFLKTAHLLLERGTYNPAGKSDTDVLVVAERLLRALGHPGALRGLVQEVHPGGLPKRSKAW